MVPQNDPIQYNGSYAPRRSHDCCDSIRRLSHTRVIERFRGRLLLSQVMTLTAWRVVAAALQAIGFLVLSRLVSVPEVGLVGLVTSIGAFAALASDLGIATLVSRSRALRKDDTVTAGLRINDITSFALMLLGGVTILILSATVGAPPALALLFASLSLERHTETQLSIFFADGDKRTPATSVMCRRVAAFVVFVILAAVGVNGVLAYSMGQLVGNVAGAVHMSNAISRLGRLDVPRAPLLNVVQEAWPFWVSGVLNQVRLLDVTIVSALVDTRAAGLYSAAQRVTNPLLLIPTAVSSIMLPHSSRLTPGEARRLANRVATLFSSLVLIALPAALLSGPAMELLFGDEYGAAGPVLAIGAISLPFIALSSPLTAIAQSQHREHLVAKMAIVFAVITLGAMAAGAVIFSAAGAIMGVGLSSALRCVFLLALIRRSAHV